eukprot:TRINITY_DN59244_c0_g1_i1.p1 TRINITY_DN59244_c0_g1~~TRINITY_DN59244_c0_g1_i1.p1  ORF type:complete len:299 (-),score=40.03 TRINITY_DN59244_c0_g1_i1:77-925(-)
MAKLHHESIVKAPLGDLFFHGDESVSSAFVAVQFVLFIVFTVYLFSFMSKARFYHTIMSWQLTIWSVHAAPIVVFRLVGLSRPIELLVCFTWIGISWFFRMKETCIFAILFVVLEVFLVFWPLVPRFVSAMCALQLIIPTVFWVALLMACASEKLTFLPLDRHLRLGIQHMCESHIAWRCLAHELIGHCGAQVLFANLLRLTLGKMPDPVVVVPDVAGIVGVYAVCAILGAVVVPPHELPYQLGVVPANLRFVLPLPQWLRGGGATVSIEKLDLPWWFKGPP